ncbi:hypothetical protein ACFYNO_17725 [Kitasatospora sp. NPDC006697]|uniref:hypothetical protein n=1 Tax=Kitasatospora sp. NPDC006697 TaxID=3364020 RepID=UPI0036B021A8
MRDAAAPQGEPGIPTTWFVKCRGTVTTAQPQEPYVLNFSALLDVPPAQRVGVVRRVRDALGARGLTISQYQESPPKSATDVPTASFRADHGTEGSADHYTVLLDSGYPGTAVSVAVSTPCLAPTAA